MVAGVEFDRLRPIGLAFGFGGFTGQIGNIRPIEGEDRFRAGTEVGIPCWVASTAEVGGDQDHPLTIGDGDERASTGLSTFCAKGGQGDDRETCQKTGGGVFAIRPTKNEPVKRRQPPGEKPSSHVGGGESLNDALPAPHGGDMDRERVGGVDHGVNCIQKENQSANLQISNRQYLLTLTPC